MNPRTRESRSHGESVVALYDDLDQGSAECDNAKPAFVSDGFCRLAGRKRADLLSVDDVSALFADSGRFRDALAGIARRRPAPARLETELLTPAGPRAVDVALRATGRPGGAVIIVRDDSRRAKIEKELRESEEKRRILFEAGNDGIFLLRGARFADCNEKTCELFGAPRGDLMQKSPLDFSPVRQPDGRSSYEKGQELLAAAWAGVRQSFDWQHARADGSVFDAEVTLSRIELAGEQLTQGTVRDITDRKRSEDVLRKYEFIANTTGSLMTLVDREYRYVAANNAYCLAQGKERGELIGRTMSDLWGEELFQTTLKPAVDACLLGRTVNYEATFRFPSDKVKIYDVTYSPYWQHERGWYVTHVVVVSHDITERRLAEQTLTREEARLKANLRLSQMLDSSIHEMCSVALLEGVRLTGSSAGYFAALSDDQKSASLLVSSGGDSPGPEDRGEVSLSLAGRWSDTLRRRTPLLLDASARGAGITWPIAAENTNRSLHIPVMDGGRIVALAGVAGTDAEYTESDVHQLTLFMNSVWQLLQQKKGRDQLRASLDEKEVLLKEIHHRVKNNLQVISSLLNLQSNYVRDVSDMEIFRESQNRIRSMALIHEKLYQSGNVSRIDFPQYARTLATTLFRSYRSAENNVRLEVDFGDVSLGIDAAVPCGLIINELISNALKHAFPEGRAGTILLGLREQGGKTRLTVRDDGVGFPQKVDVRRPESLGLQLVNTLVAQIGGVLEVERSSGTEFRIAFATPGQSETP